MSILKTFAASRAARVGLAAGVVAAGVLGAVQSASAAAQTLKLSSATGPASSTTTVLTVTGTGFKNSAGAVQVGTVDFNAATTCPAAAAGTAAGKKTVLSATTLIVTTPSLADTVASGVHSKKTYQLCVYNSSAALLGTAAYSVYPRPAVTSVTPASGPAAGGNTITIVATGLTAKSTVTVGGTAATGIKVAADGLSLTAVVPAHAPASGQTVAVTTEGGTSTTTGTYGFVNAVTVSPTLVVYNAATSTTLDITGAGFNTTFAVANTNAGVALQPLAAFDGTATGGSAPVACTNLQVVSDTELVCDVANTIAKGTYTVYVADDATSASPTLVNVISSSATVTVADF